MVKIEEDAVIKIEDEEVVTEVVEPSEPSCGTSASPQRSETGKTPPQLDCHLCPFIAESETALLDHIRGHTRCVTSATSESVVGQPTPKLFTESNGQVYLGEGLYMPEAKLNRILYSKNEVKAARDMARHFWTKAERKIRNFTGRTPDGVAKQVATPEKVEAVMDVVRKVVKDNLTEVPAAKRIAFGRKAVRDIFAETSRGQPRKSL